MAAHGLITPMPRYAVFSNLGAERPETYTWLKQLARLIPFPIKWLQPGSITNYALQSTVTRKTETEHLNRLFPQFYKAHGKTNIADRRCTTLFKILPIRRQHHRHIKSGVVCWLGISTDEAIRMRDSDLLYLTNRYPLIELKMSRQDCKQWLTDHGYPLPPKSSCVFCPFQKDAQWRDLQDNHPQLFQNACKLELAIQDRQNQIDPDGPQMFFHRSCVTLSEAKFTATDRTNGFGNDCSGFCGT